MFRRTKRKSRKGKSNRRGTSAVEFATVAPIFFLTLFACIEFSKFWIAETFVESAVFQTARDLSVFGASVEEGRPFAAGVLSTIGIDDFEITITPLDRGVPQTEIIDTTSHVRVTIEVPAREISTFGSWLKDIPITRSAESITNRPQ